MFFKIYSKNLDMSNPSFIIAKSRKISIRKRR